MELCVRCKKRMAVVFITRMENGKTLNEGLCLHCARELGIKPINSMLEKMGLSEEDLDRMDMEMEQLAAEHAQDNEDEEENDNLPAEEDSGDGEDASRAPTIPLDFRKFLGPLIDKNGPSENASSDDPAGAKTKKSPEEKSGRGKRKFLEMYCRNLTRDAMEGKLDTIIGRERELERVIQILCRRQKNNPCLIGEPGVGKTAIAEALAERIAAGNVPARLSQKEVYVVDLTGLVAGTQFRGQFESRMKNLIDEVKALGNIILVIDEVHSIVGAGDAEGSMNAANILKPALSKGEIQLIGATTLTEYRKYIEKDSALERRFQPVTVEEPSIADSVNILKGIKHYYEQFHGINIPDSLIEPTVTMAERYITDRFLPDKAIDLLDEASAYCSLHAPVIDRVNALQAQLETIRREREKLENEDPGTTDEAVLTERYKQLADLKTQQINDEATLQKLQEERNAVTLREDDLAKVIETWTGIPASSITEQEFERIDKLAERLRQRIIGQDQAVDAVARAIKRNRAGVSLLRKPVSFIFAGSTGVGKTALVRALADDLFHSPETLIRLDMSEFMEKHSVSRIIGAPPGYVGYDEAGQLTEKIRRKPYSVVLFDEIEKAHPDVLNILLQILDEGRVTDAQGRTVHFENTVIVMTTNAGSEQSMNTPGFGESEQILAEDRTQKALASFLRPEFINRVDEIITFRTLSEEDFTAIAGLMLNDLRQALAEQNIAVTWTPEAAAFIAKHSYSRRFGARNMRRYMQTQVEDVIAGLLIAGYAKTTVGVSIRLRTGADGKEELAIRLVTADRPPLPSDPTGN